MTHTSQSPDTDNFLVFDPKIMRRTDSVVPTLRNTFNDVRNLKPSFSIFDID